MIVTPFLPTYEVTFTMYHVIPGFPVKKNDSNHRFGKGESDAAMTFFNKVVNSTIENRIAPTEILLRKGKRVIKYRQFGPISDIKKFKIAA